MSRICDNGYQYTIRMGIAAVRERLSDIEDTYEFVSELICGIRRDELDLGHAGTLELAPAGSIANSSGVSIGTGSTLAILGDGGNAVAQTLPSLSASGPGGVLSVASGVTLTISGLAAALKETAVKSASGMQR